ncbi:bi-domain-containing oxidoreductase [Desulfomonile tiedjei]|uniref:Putative dehydrogenase n=1 Tax=Desulfomonile tiedjei (strain ATCC 49306 / DSM 6799 / DCB-1) TaxID=706587 RepID=I4C252_DESTA|nr:bi-domain-containing oxidoreductase [Desulfomonile tiedjei]AFM23643.1 putative dehydrogenase [Desulfomonile tiedjei DSM 6799]
MYKITQNIRNGAISVDTVPQPLVQAGHLLIANVASVISPGTEKALMELSQKSLIGKARQRPDQVRRVLEKIRNEGLFQTLAQVQEKLDEPMNMGYSSAGIVLAVGAGVQNFRPGDRVASNGPHAGVVCVPKNLCAMVPEKVPLDHAAFAVLGAIALQSIRLSEIKLGETVLVIGLGLIGQITVALLNAAGARVLAVDLDRTKCELASTKMGAEEARPDFKANDILDRTSGFGVDAVIISASTKSNDPIDLAAAAVRQKGRIVLTGVVGLELDRRPFYFKEAEFVVSCSYGPGRYDPFYETYGQDYPPAHVRWTEQRNIQAVLDLMAAGRLDVSPLISRRVPIENALEAYNSIRAESKSQLGILLTYPEAARCGQNNHTQALTTQSPPLGKIPIGCLGAGNFARLVLLPCICRIGDFHPKTLCSAGGTSAVHSGKKLGFDYATTDENTVLHDEEIQAVFIATQHDRHARQVLKAIEAGKDVFVEKPLALSIEDIIAIDDAIENCPGVKPLLMVGFNRRFSPAALAVREFFSRIAQPKTICIRFNAGPIPESHWSQHESIGGGRIVGEACHAIDLATFFAESPPCRVYAESIGGTNAPRITEDQCLITVKHVNGSVSSIAYLAGGDKAFPKERVEVFGGGQIAVIDDFREIIFCSNGKTKRQRSFSTDKGHRQEIESFAKALTEGTASPISWEELKTVSLAAILAVRSVHEGIPFEIPARFRES